MNQTEVLTEAVRPFAEFGARDELDTAMDTAQRRLATTDNFFYRGARPV